MFSNNHVQLHMHDLRAHLEDRPFNDWLELYGRRWLEKQSSDTLHAIYQGIENTTDFQMQLHKMTRVEKGRRTIGGSSCHACAKSTSVDRTTADFVAWVMDECTRNQSERPMRITNDMFSDTTWLRVAHQYPNIILHCPKLMLQCSCSLQPTTSVALVLNPRMLLSRSLAESLFGDAMQAAVGPGARFSRWVSVELNSSSSVGANVVPNKRRITHTNRTHRFMASKMQAVFEATKQWQWQWQEKNGTQEDVVDIRPTIEPFRDKKDTSLVAGVVLHPSDPLTSAKFYVCSPPVVALRGTTPPTTPTNNSHPSKLVLETRPPWYDAMCWAVQLRKDGSTWDPVTDNEHVEMCPSASDRGSSDVVFWPLVRWLRDQREDMCKLHKVSYAHRAKAWAKGARTYHDIWTMQKTLQPILKLSAASRAILWANYKDNPEPAMVVPRKLRKPTHRQFISSITTDQKYFVVDFETIRSEWIFMVAVVCCDPVSGTHEVFVEQMDSLTDTAQVQLLKRWIERMHGLYPLTPPASSPTTGPTWTLPPILHWSSAEPVFLSSLFRRKPQLLAQLVDVCPLAHMLLKSPPVPHPIFSVSDKSPDNLGLCWVDLCAVFTSEPIAIPGCFDFQLKHVTKSLAKLGNIPSTHVWDSDGVQDGLAAMRHAEEAYALGTAATSLQSVRKYNKADVLVLMDIVQHALANML